MNRHLRAPLRVDIPIGGGRAETPGRAERSQEHNEEKTAYVKKKLSPNEVASFPFQDNNESFDSITDGFRNTSANESEAQKILPCRPSNPIAKILSREEKIFQFRPIPSNDTAS